MGTGSSDPLLGARLVRSAWERDRVRDRPLLRWAHGLRMLALTVRGAGSAPLLRRGWTLKRAGPYYAGPPRSTARLARTAALLRLISAAALGVNLGDSATCLPASVDVTGAACERSCEAARACAIIRRAKSEALRPAARDGVVRVSVLPRYGSCLGGEGGSEATFRRIC